MIHCGTLQRQESEVDDLGYFLPHELPEGLHWWNRQPIEDAFNSVGGSVVWFQDLRWPFEEGLTREQVYAQRDRGELSLQQLHDEWCRKPRSEEQVREVGG